MTTQFENNDGIASGFDLLKAQLEEAETQLRNLVSVATHAGKYDQGRKLIAQAQRLESIIQETHTLHERIDEFFSQVAILSDPEPVDPRPRPSPPGRETRLMLIARNCEAYAVLDGEAVIVLRDSTIAARNYDSISRPARQLRREFLSLGRLVRDESSNTLTLQVDHRFPSPSAAACFVVGYAANGQLMWKIEGTSTSLGDWQRSRMSSR